MKKFFYLFVFLMVTMAVFAQAPGGIGGSVLWLKANSASPSSWDDASGTLNHFTQPAPANQPVLSSNVLNFNAALDFDGVNSFMSNAAPVGFPENSAARTILVVAKGPNPVGYHWIFVYGTPAFSSAFQVGAYDGGLANSFYGSDVVYPGYWGAAGNLNGALTSFAYDGLDGFQYDRGSFIQNQTLGDLFTTSANAVIGAFDVSLLQPWAGSIGEIILFPSALSDADRHQVESYLGLKYGFTLGSTGDAIDYIASDGTTIFWPGSGTFQNDVFGIGFDAGSDLIQLQSNSMNTGNGDGSGQSGKGNMVLSTSSLTDMQFLMIGNDGGALTEHLVASGEAPAIAENSQRLERNWKVKNTGSVGPVDLTFDITGLTSSGGTTASNYRLMVDDDGDGDYSSGTPYFLTPASFTGNVLNFTGITLPDNANFALITLGSADLLPAVWEGFTATLQRNTATLTWKTSAEVNVDHYTVEYSSNGVNYTSAGSVAAKNAAGTNTYTLTQTNLPAGIRYYRIKRFDKDGKSDISTVKTVRVGGLTSVVIKSNPVTRGRLELNIDVQQNQDAVIRIVNTAGKVLVQQNTGLSGGTNSVTTNISNLRAGTYFLQVQLATEIINKKFIRL